MGVTGRGGAGSMERTPNAADTFIPFELERRESGPVSFNPHSLDCFTANSAGKPQKTNGGTHSQPSIKDD